MGDISYMMIEIYKKSRKLLNNEYETSNGIYCTVHKTLKFHYKKHELSVSGALPKEVFAQTVRDSVLGSGYITGRS